MRLPAIAAMLAVSASIASPALAHHVPNDPPHDVRVVKRVYPDLAARAHGARLHRMVASRWWRTHPEALRMRRIRSLIAHPTPAGNREIARLYLSPDDFACMEGIVGRESSWVHDVWNRAGSGAYGIPQALPGSKMSSAGADWATNPLTQIRWMKGYAESRYGSLCSALSFRTSRGYY